jgi:hypothetical protein
MTHDVITSTQSAAPTPLRQITTILKADLRNRRRQAFLPKHMTKKRLINPKVSSTILTGFVLIYIGAILINFYAQIANTFGPGAIPAWALMTSVIVILINDFISLGTTLFETNRYEQIRSLPVSTSTIAWSRIISGLTGSFITALYFLGCASIVWIRFADILSIMRLMLFGTIIGPMYVSIMSIGVFIIGYELNRTFRAGKTLLVGLISCVIIAPFIIFSYCMIIPEAREVIVPLVDKFNIMPQVLNLFTQACEGNLLALVMIATPGIVVYAVFMTWISRNLDAIIALKGVKKSARTFTFDQLAAGNTRNEAANSNACATAIEDAGAAHEAVLPASYKSAWHAIIAKDARFFKCTFALFINLGIILLLMVVIALIFCLVYQFMLADAPFPIRIACTVAADIPVYMMAAPIALYTITLEGNKWWHMQTAPIPAKTLYHAKLTEALIPSYIAIALCEILYNVFLPLGLAERFVLLITPISITLFMQILAFSMDAHQPNFSWDDTHSITQAIKRPTFAFAMMMMAYVSISITLLVCFNPLMLFIPSDILYCACALVICAIFWGITYLIYLNIMDTPLAES